MLLVLVPQEQLVGEFVLAQVLQQLELQEPELLLVQQVLESQQALRRQR
jgi:hypothetical protein